MQMACFQREREITISLGVECNLLHNAYFGHDFVETGIAPAVARKGENPLVAGHRPMFEQDVVRHFEQPDIHLGTRLAACRTDP